jgi:hypothetical protein
MKFFQVCRSCKFAASLAMLTFIMAPLQSQAGLIYDLGDDWSIGSQPSGAWQYGNYDNGLGGNFTQFGVSGNGGVVGVDDLRSLEFWSNGGDPNIIKNTGTTFTTQDLDQITFNADAVTFGPYLGPAVARWTATFAGLYAFESSFNTVQVGNTAPKAYVSVNGTQTSLGTLNALIAHSGQVSLSSGQWIDFIVWGDNSGNKTTEVSATITSVPEPAILSLLALSLLSMSAVRRRRKD